MENYIAGLLTGGIIYGFIMISEMILKDLKIKEMNKEEEIISKRLELWEKRTKGLKKESSPTACKQREELK